MEIHIREVRHYKILQYCVGRYLTNKRRPFRVNEPGNNRIDINELRMHQNLKPVFGKYKIVIIITLQPSC